MARMALLGIGVALAVLSSLGGEPGPIASAFQGGLLVGIDADPSHNTATSLDSIDGCISVEPGATTEIDLFVENVADLGAWQATVIFDPAVLRIVDKNTHLFLEAQPGANPLDLSEDLPSDTGAYLVAVADFGTGQGEGESGSGVLARLTVEAVDSGTTELQLSNVVLVSSLDEAQGDVNGDTYYDGPTSSATIAVGAPCPEETAVSTPQVSPTTNVTPGAATATPTTTPTAASPTPGTPTPTATSTAGPSPTSGSEAEDDGGFPWAVVGGVVGGVAAVVVLGLVLGWRFRRAP
jgi:hypothetical protein